MNEEQQYNEVCRPMFDAIFEKMACKDEQDKIGKTVELIYCKLFEGNGSQSFSTRLSLLEQAGNTSQASSSNTRNWLLGIVAAIIVLVAQTMFIDWLATRNHISQDTKQVSP